MRAQRRDQLVPRRFLEDIAARPCMQRAFEVGARTMRGEDQDSGRRRGLEDAARGFDAVHAGHRDVEDGDGRTRPRRHVDRLDAIEGPADNLEIALGLQQRAHAIGQQGWSSARSTADLARRHAATVGSRRWS